MALLMFLMVWPGIAFAQSQSVRLPDVVCVAFGPELHAALNDPLIVDKTLRYLVDVTGSCGPVSVKDFLDLRITGSATLTGDAGTCDPTDDNVGSVLNVSNSEVRIGSLEIVGGAGVNLNDSVLKSNGSNSITGSDGHGVNVGGRCWQPGEP